MHASATSVSGTASLPITEVAEVSYEISTIRSATGGDSEILLFQSSVPRAFLRFPFAIIHPEPTKHSFPTLSLSNTNLPAPEYRPRAHRHPKIILPAYSATPISGQNVIFKPCEGHVFQGLEELRRLPFHYLSPRACKKLHIYTSHLSQHSRRHQVTVARRLQPSTLKSMASRKTADQIYADIPSLHHRQS